jgi:transcriptional regulator with XRE-family HTH domain
MRPSPLRHPLAVLRQIIGFSQKEMADLVGKSTSAIQAIELRKLDLSEELARKVSLETGIAMKWLMDGDPSVPPVPDSNNQPVFSDEQRNFSKAVFDRRRADREAGKSGWGERIFFTGCAGAKLTAIEHAAINHPDRTIMQYRVSKFLEGLQKEFGIRKNIWTQNCSSRNSGETLRTFLKTLKVSLARTSHHIIGSLSPHSSRRTGV